MVAKEVMLCLFEYKEEREGFFPVKGGLG